MNIKQPSLLMLTAAAAALSTVAHGLNSSADTAQENASPTKLGSAIQAEMGERKRTSGERARALDLREQALKASEKRLQTFLRKQQEQEQEKQQQATTTPKTKSAKTDPRTKEAETFDQLARIYQSMKAKQAALVFERLHIEVQIGVARKMRERSTAQILAAMTPAGAARLSMALAGKPTGPRATKPDKPG